MKYRCKDCGAVYDKKIEYCECGNNTFDIWDTEVKKPALEQDRGLLLSWLFFAFCIILSLIILFVIPNGADSPAEKMPPVEKIVKQNNIPDIDDIWKDPVLPEPQPEPEETTTPEPVVIIQKIIKRIETPAVQQPQQIAKPVSKPVAQKPVVQKPAEQKVEQPKPVQKPQTTQTTQKPVQKPVVKEQSKPVVKTEQQPLDSSVIKYRNILREVLLSKLNVGSVSGSGTCVIQFSVDSSGKLINRKFVRYANNKSMNDAIYYMMMSVPKFQPPPPAYKGETFKIQFTIDNGAYEISFL